MVTPSFLSELPHFLLASSGGDGHVIALSSSELRSSSSLQFGATSLWPSSF